MNKYRILSFNLRVNVAVDGKNAWDYRKDKVFQFVKTNDFDIIGFQEVTPSMYTELKSQLSDFHAVGDGRDKDQEANPVFFKKDKYRLIESKTLWLSTTPSIESKIDGSHYSRIVTYVILEEESSQRIAYFNTHLDYASDEVCKKQATVLLKIIDDVSQLYTANPVLSGDFNQLPNSQTIKHLSMQYENIFDKNENLGLTFHDFSNRIKGEPIDYFFYSKNLNKLSFKIVHHQSPDHFLSDHYPLIAEFKIKNSHHTS